MKVNKNGMKNIVISVIILILVVGWAAYTAAGAITRFDTVRVWEWRWVMLAAMGIGTMATTGIGIILSLNRIADRKENNHEK